MRKVLLLVAVLYLFWGCSAAVSYQVEEREPNPISLTDPVQPRTTSVPAPEWAPTAQGPAESSAVEQYLEDR
jgi:PBP1b-binding outer membrane lipoprotein LpoB